MKRGFTLVEILITLVMIGMVASLTIPSLVNNINDQQNKVAWRKAFSDISQATMRISADNGGSLKGLFTGYTAMSDKYGQYLNYTKKCYGMSNFGNCWHEIGSFKTLSSSTPETGYYDEAALLLNNGMLLSINYDSANCTYTSENPEGNCGKMFVDVNGFKGPNVIGKDIFAVHVQENRVKPFGSQNDAFNPATNCTLIGTGYGCSALYLYQ